MSTMDVIILPDGTVMALDWNEGRTCRIENTGRKLNSFGLVRLLVEMTGRRVGRVLKHRILLLADARKLLAQE